jgi:hypothetical protein
LRKLRDEYQRTSYPNNDQRKIVTTKTQKWNDFKERRHVAILKYLNQKRLQRGIEKLVRVKALQFMIQTLLSKIEK